MSGMSRTNGYLLMAFIVFFSSLSTILVRVRVGLSLSTLLVIITIVFSALFIVTRSNISKSIIKFAWPIFALSIYSTLFDIYNLLINNDTPKNDSIVLIATALCIILPSLIDKNIDRVLNIVNLVFNYSNYVIVSVSICILFFLDSDPAFAIVSLIFFCFNLSRFLSLRSVIPLFFAVYLFYFSVIQDSRIITIACLAVSLLAISIFQGIQLRNRLLILLLIVPLSIALLHLHNPIESSPGGDSALEISGHKINTSGRMYWWGVVFKSAMKTPLFGTGYSVSKKMQNVKRWAHPHNDYLRLFHRYGIVGVGLWFFFVVKLIRRLIIIHRSNLILKNKEMATSYYTVTLSIAGLSVVMITDNPLAYPYVMMPAGILFGLTHFLYQPKTNG